MEQVDSAFHAAALNPDSVVLLGIEPEKAETSYGWIEPARSLFGGEARSFSRVERFWEKPSEKVASRLKSAGCLWNSFVMVGRADAFVAMFREHLPKLFRMFNVSKPFFGRESEKAIVRSIYAWIGETNFSSEVLENAVNNLMVMRVADVGWSDLGEPQRVLSTLSTLGISPVWASSVAA
jgi:mannose-1-phosphate guanylyltransferase